MSELKEIKNTIYDIAGVLKISPASVSRGIKDHPGINKKTINETSFHLDYRSNAFASNLRHNKTCTLGVIVPCLNSIFMCDAMSGMEKAANEAGYNLIINQ